MSTSCLLQGDQNSPGIIPLAIKDVFSMIQEVSKRLYGPGVGFFQLHFPVNTNILLHPSPLIILLNCFQS